MNQKSVIIILIMIIIFLVSSLSYLAFIVKPDTPPITQAPSSMPAPELTREIALSLLGMECHSEGIQGEYASCDLNISTEENQWEVSITYDGLFDDSVRAYQYKITVKYQNGQWFSGQILQTQKCQPGRGHQIFSSERCI